MFCRNFRDSMGRRSGITGIAGVSKGIPRLINEDLLFNS
jgi:hypothetical protein